MENDALTKGKEKGKGKGKGNGKGKEKGKEKGRAKSKDKPKEGTPDKSRIKCFFCKEKGHARKDCPKFSAWLAEKKTVGREPSANAIEEAGWIFALEQGPNSIENQSNLAINEHEELCELIMIACALLSMAKRTAFANRRKRDHC